MHALWVMSVDCVAQDLIAEDHEVNKWRKTEIKEKFAFHLFVQNKFNAALKMFRSVETGQPPNPHPHQCTYVCVLETLLV